MVNRWESCIYKFIHGCEGAEKINQRVNLWKLNDYYSVYSPSM